MDYIKDLIKVETKAYHCYEKLMNLENNKKKNSKEYNSALMELIHLINERQQIIEGIEINYHELDKVIEYLSEQSELDALDSSSILFDEDLIELRVINFLNDLKDNIEISDSKENGEIDKLASSRICLIQLEHIFLANIESDEDQIYQKYLSAFINSHIEEDMINNNFEVCNLRINYLSAIEKYLGINITLDLEKFAKDIIDEMYLSNDKFTLYRQQCKLRACMFFFDCQSIRELYEYYEGYKLNGDKDVEETFIIETANELKSEMLDSISFEEALEMAKDVFSKVSYDDVSAEIEMAFGFVSDDVKNQIKVREYKKIS